MAKVGELEVIIDGKTHKLQQATKRAGKDVNKLGNRIKKVGAMVAGAFAVRGIVNFGKKAVAAANEQQKAEAQLLNSLRGRKDVQQRLLKQASQLQKQTLFGDEETIKAQALIANLGLQEEQIKNLIPVIQDFATEQGIGLTQAAQRVQRVIGQGSDTFKKYGADLDSTASKSQNAQVLIDTMGKTLQGTARSAANAGSAGITQMQNAIGDLMEEVGEALLPTLNKMAERITKLAAFISENKNTILSWGKAIGRAAVVLGVARVAMLAFNSALAANPIGLIVTAIGLLVSGLVTAWKESEVFRAKVKYVAQSVAAFFKRTWVGIKIGVKTLFQTIKTYFQSIGTSAATLWKAIKAIFTKGKSPGQVLRDGFSNIKNDFKKVGSDARKELEKEMGKIKNPSYEKILAAEKAGKEGKKAGEEAKKGFDQGFASTGGGGGATGPAIPESPVEAKKKKIDVGGDMEDDSLFSPEETLRQREEMQRVNAQLDAYLEKQRQNEEMQNRINNQVADMGAGLVEGFMNGENMAEKLNNTLKDLIKNFIKAAAKAAILSALQGGTGGAAGGGFSIIQGALGIGMAKGGQVPSGFPGDSYPAMLTSGETVIPPKTLDRVMSGMQGGQGGRLEATVSGDDLKFVLKKADNRNNIIS